MSDLIERQAAYDALMAEPPKLYDSSVWESARCHQWRMDMDAIKALPSAQPDHWVPCSERLPEKSGLYLTWTKFPYEEEPSWLIINYDADCESFGEWEEHYHPDTLGYLDSEFNEFENVFAWMPLPEPYREEGGQS
jgi:hypothetical protein